MATVGICSYCENTATRTCTMCGKAICKDHEESTNQGVCHQCAKGGVMG